jgi:hypothetical protein
MALRLRLALVVAALTAVLVAGGSVAFALSMSAGTRATLEHSLQRRARRVDAQLGARLLPVAGGDNRPAPSVDQSTVQILGPLGRLLYTTAAAGPTPLLSGAMLPQAQRGPVWGQQRRPGWDNPHLVLAEPVGRGSADVVVVGASLDQVFDTTHRVDLVLELAGPLVVAASAIGAWLLAGSALRPVERLRAQVQEISAGDPRTRIPRPGTHDELAALADTFNDLLDRLRGLVDRQRLFVAAASHELRTPLAALAAELEMAGRTTPDAGNLAEVTRRLAGRVAELGRLSNSLLVLAHADEGAALLHIEPQPLQPLIATSLAGYRAVAEHRGLTLVLDANPFVVAPVDAIRFRQVVENLVDNAVRYSPRGALVEVGLRRTGSTAVIDVRDHGPGFPAEFAPHAFERFSRADPSRSRDEGGAGLGLAIVWTIVSAHGGTVTVATAPGGGAIATVSLPLDPGPVGAEIDPSPR